MLQKQTFLQGTLVLIVANGLTKLIGACFKIPLTYLLHEEGMAIFNTAYQLYVFLFIIATAGLPVAVSKMVSERLALDDIQNAKRVFRAEMILIIGLGLIGALALFLFAEPIALYVVDDSATISSIRAVAPALIFVAAMAGLRGFFQGTQNMIPTALSEVVEASGKPLVGYGLAFLLIAQGIEVASAGAIMGVTAGAFAGCVLMIVIFWRSRKRIFGSVADCGAKLLSYRSIFRTLIWIAVPITIGACVSSLTTLIDTAMVRGRLQSISFAPEAAKALFDYYGQPDGLSSLLRLGRLDETGARWLYGAYSGYAFSLFNLPLTLIFALSTSVVPAVASAYAMKNRRAVQGLTASALRITVLFSLPCTAGLSVLAGPILQLVFHNTASTQMLEILALSVVWVTLVSVTTAILQAVGRVWLPVIHMAIGGLVKIVCNYVLIGLPSVHILGASLSTNACYFVIAALNLFWVMRVTRVKLRIRDIIVKPLFATVAMGVLTLFVYRVLERVLPSSSLATIGAIGLGCVLYLATLLLVKGIRRDDVEMLPKGSFLVAQMERYHLLKEDE